MGFIDTIKARAKADKKTIVLPESEDRSSPAERLSGKVVMEGSF